MPRYAGQFRTRWIFPLVAAGVLCAPALPAGGRLAGGEIEIQRSHRRAPEWTVRTPDADRTYLYFVGRATNAPSLEAAENDAAADVVRQIVTAIGLEASFNYDRLRSEADVLLADRIELAGNSRIVGLKRIETYYEKQTITGDRSVKTSWNAHVLARYPVESLENETSRLEQLAKARVSTAESQLAESRRMESLGYPHRAWDLVAEALELTGQLSVLTDPATGSRIAMVRQQLVDRARALSIPLRRVSVGELEFPGGDVPADDGGRSIQSALEADLRDEGFGIERSSEAAAAGALPIVSLVVTEETGYKIEPGFHFSRWSAALSISEPGGGSMLFGNVYPLKGFGIDPARAALDAMRKLRTEILPKFAAEAWRHFECNLAGEGKTGRSRSL
ncbi:MAG: hypothetical protein FVQ81_02815 [Candidatus Glassbacteria bacterium]|nr:hypothetical protein [Candidatus Glassbacteria bacterium]